MQGKPKKKLKPNPTTTSDYLSDFDDMICEKDTPRRNGSALGSKIVVAVVLAVHRSNVISARYSKQHNKLLLLTRSSWL